MDEFLDKNFPLKRYIPPQISTKKLPITTNVISHTYLFLSLKLAMLQSNEKKTVHNSFLYLKNTDPMFHRIFGIFMILMKL